MSVNVCGLFGGHIGLAQAAKNSVLALEAAGVRVSVVNYPRQRVKERRHEWSDRGVIHDLTLFVCNPDIYSDVAAAIRLPPRRVALWFWELENLPAKWVPYLEHFEEIWCPSTFIYDAVAKHTDKLRLTPLPVSVEGTVNRAMLRIPEGKLVVLTMYDANSTHERKNPFAAIDAFRLAAIPDSWLVVKTQHARKDKTLLKRALKGLKNCTVIDKTLPRLQACSLIRSCDVLLSLHRSEGFGLPLAEAMALGTVAIGTRYGGNVDFMTEDNSLLVDYELVDTPPPPHVYSGQQWAEPSVVDASEKLKAIAVAPMIRAQLAAQAAKDIPSLADAGAVYREGVQCLTGANC